ncbi:MAG TPA: hypothetical protein VFR34_02240 [Paracoccaceae bacterium]|nr:hypothetical protein [Paracoccaceae bacterium]
MNLPPARLVALLLTLFAAFFLFVVFGGLAAPDVTLFRAHASAWSAALLALPALCLFLLRAGRQPLGQSWRLWWTAGWVMIAVHLWWGLGRLHDWDLASVVERQGWHIAGPIFVLEILWAADMVLTWARSDWAEARGAYLAWQWLVWCVAAASFCVSLAIFQNDATSLWIGLFLTLALILAALRRLAEGEPA